MTFSTRTYKSRVAKSATIYTNDLSNSQIRIKVNAQVDPAPDTTLPFSYSPDALTFTQGQKTFNVVFTNKSGRTMYLKPVGGTHEDLSLKMDDMQLKAGEDKEIQFSWTGEFEKENIERSITFDVSALGSERVTIPFVVEGTDPTPAKAPVSQRLKPKQVKGGSKKE